jgi:hypothetical protein
VPTLTDRLKSIGSISIVQVGKRTQICKEDRSRRSRNGLKMCNIM